MLQPLADNLWCAEHAFNIAGIPISSRMTVARLKNGGLWLHSPIPLDAPARQQLDVLGPVQHVVAPSKMHHLFAGDLMAHYPAATLYGPPGLKTKRPDLLMLQRLPESAGPWGPELQWLLFEGIPAANETVWFHAPSATVIFADLCQWWRGQLPWQTHLFTTLTGVRKNLDMARSVRALVRDKAAARASAQKILQWPFKRIIVAHNTVVQDDARALLTHAFRHLQ